MAREQRPLALLRSARARHPTRAILKTITTAPTAPPAAARRAAFSADSIALSSCSDRSFCMPRSLLFNAPIALFLMPRLLFFYGPIVFLMARSIFSQAPIDLFEYPNHAARLFSKPLHFRRRHPAAARHSHHPVFRSERVCMHITYRSMNMCSQHAMYMSTHKFTHISMHIFSACRHAYPCI